MLRHWLEQGRRPSKETILQESPAVKTYWTQFDSLFLQDGVITRRWHKVDGSLALLPVIPRCLVSEILASLHDSPTGGHLGRNKTLKKVESRFYWIGRSTDVKVWCSTCKECSARKGPQRKVCGPLQPSTVGAPFERIAIDVLGPLPSSTRGNRYIVVVMDYFSKWPECFALPDQTSVRIVDRLVESIFCRFGVPHIIHSDQGRNFEAEIFRRTLERLGVQKTRTTPLHPQSDGMVERFNRTLLDYLAKFVEKNQQNWDEYLPLALLAYRSSVHESTGFSPALIFLGRELRLPTDLECGVSKDLSTSPPEYLRNLLEKMETIYERVRTNLKLTSERMKARYDLRTNLPVFQVGEEVWLHNPRRRRGLSPKLQSEWDGPAKIISKISDLVVKIQMPGKRTTKVVHINRLAPFTAR